MSAWPFAIVGERPPELAVKDLSPVTVAVLDSGVDATHPDLAGRVVSAYRLEGDEEQPQLIEVPSDTNNDVFGHGTAVAGIICRLAPNARIVDVRVLDNHGCGSGQAMLAGLRIMVEGKRNNKPRIINLSLASRAKFKQEIFDLCETAYNANQIVVASKRNIPLGDYGFPAELSNCISVDSDTFPTPYTLEYLSDSIIEFAAHGEEVVVPAVGGGYTTQTGTSFATPAISAICTLLVSAYPGLRPFEIKTLLRALSVNPPPTGTRDDAAHP